MQSAFCHRDGGVFPECIAGRESSLSRPCFAIFYSLSRFSESKSDDATCEPSSQASAFLALHSDINQFNKYGVVRFPYSCVIPRLFFLVID